MPAPGNVIVVDQNGGEHEIPQSALQSAVDKGWTEQTAEGRLGTLAELAHEESAGGFRGTVGAFGAGALNAATLGGSNALIGAVGGEDARSELSRLAKVNPTASVAGELAGGLAASFAAPGSVLAATPAGRLSALANTATAELRATTTGVRALAGQAAITGAEAAAQSAGSYLGSVALGDRELTAEGLGGALGAGFAFGAAGGGAVYGLEKGSIAARNLFSRVMDGGDDAARTVGGTWERTSSQAFDANRSVIDEAKRRVDEASRAVEEAKLAQQRAGNYYAQERGIASEARRAPGPAADVPAAPAPEVIPFSFSSNAGAALDDVAGAPMAAAKPRVPGREGVEAGGDALDQVLISDVAARPAPYAKGAPTSDVPTGGGDDFARRAQAFADDEYEAHKTLFLERSGMETFGAGMHYSKGGDEVINAALRDGTPLSGRYAETAATLDNAFALPEATIPRDMMLYRGVNGKAAQQRFANVKAGDIVEDPAFLSTSGVVNSKSRNEDIVFNILAPKGSKALPIATHYNFEKEMLLPRGTRLRVDSNDLVPSVPTATRHADAISHEVLPDKTVRVTFPQSGGRPPVTYSYKPIREINVSIVDDASGAARALADLPPPVQSLATKVTEAEDAESALMRMLQGTKARIDEGATIGEVGTAARAMPASPKQLTDSYDDLVEKAAQAADVETKQALLRQASVLEDQLAALPKSAQALSELDSVTQAMSRYERAMADLVDEVGDGASPLSREMADKLRKAEGDVDRQMFDRAAQAIDDAASAPSGFTRIREEGVKTGTQQVGAADADAPLGPAKVAPQERVAYAKERKGEADATMRSARITETEARNAYKAANRTEIERVNAARKAAETVGIPGAPVTPQATGAAARAADIGGIMELVGGIPGLPKPSDLPIVGPLLGLWLQARAIGGIGSKLMGRVPASGNAKAAALAATVRDKAARVVDRMLGHVERAAPKMRTVVAVAGPKLVEAVQERLHDDGTPAPPRDAGLQDQVAARSRELAALSANPALITAQVRKAMQGVADPDTVAAAVAFRTAQIAYLNKVAPKEPPPPPFAKPWKPDKQLATDFARKYAVAMDPIQALEQIEQKCLTPEAAEAFRAVYPKLFEQTRARLLTRATTLQTTLPRAQLTRMSILFDIPLDSALEPATLSRIQGAFAATRPADQTPQPVPPAPSIAGPTNLTALYQTASDRRAAAR